MSDWRAGTAERDAAASTLAEHFAAGRLGIDEFRDRLDAVFAATWAADLARATADLPALAAAQVPGTGRAAPRPGRGQRPPRYRPGRVLALLALLLITGLTGAGLLAAALLPHGGLILAALVFLMVPAVLACCFAAVMAWAVRRAWRSGAWLEAVPVAAGMPWLGRLVWLARALLAARALHRIARRHGYASRWAGGQPRVGDLSGTTR